MSCKIKEKKNYQRIPVYVREIIFFELLIYFSDEQRSFFWNFQYNIVRLSLSIFIYRIKVYFQFYSCEKLHS